MSDDEKDDAEPTPLAEAAASAHEMFVTFMDTGFTEMQALYLTAQILLGQR